MFATQEPVYMPDKLELQIERNLDTKAKIISYIVFTLSSQWFQWFESVTLV